MTNPNVIMPDVSLIGSRVQWQKNLSVEDIEDNSIPGFVLLKDDYGEIIDIADESPLHYKSFVIKDRKQDEELYLAALHPDYVKIVEEAAQ